MTRVRDANSTIDQEEFERCPQEVLCHVSGELNIPQSTVYKILKVKLHEHANKIQVVQILRKVDYNARVDFCQQFKRKIHNSHGFLNELTFSDEATFSGIVNHHNFLI